MGALRDIGIFRKPNHHLGTLGLGDTAIELNSPHDHLAFDRFESTFLFLEGDYYFYQVDLPTMFP